jgi:hypothetical protein
MPKREGRRLARRLNFYLRVNQIRRKHGEGVTEFRVSMVDLANSASIWDLRIKEGRASPRRDASGT